jgi:hypothetical protein
MSIERASGSGGVPQPPAEPAIAMTAFGREEFAALLR